MAPTGTQWDVAVPHDSRDPITHTAKWSLWAQYDLGLLKVNSGKNLNKKNIYKKIVLNFTSKCSSLLLLMHTGGMKMIYTQGIISYVFELNVPSWDYEGSNDQYNLSNTSQPMHNCAIPVKGSLWYITTIKQIKVWNVYTFLWVFCIWGILITTGSPKFNACSFVSFLFFNQNLQSEPKLV